VRKVIIAPVKYGSSIPTEAWLDLENLAVVQVTSEEPASLLNLLLFLTALVGVPLIREHRRCV
jgi:hypothetical protein